MPTPEFIPLTPAIWVWQTYDPAVKSDLFCTAIQSQTGVYLIDPIPGLDAGLGAVTKSGRIGGVIVTNANHWRAASRYSASLSVPIFTHSKYGCDAALSAVREVVDGAVIGEDLAVIEISGAAAGEMALYHAANGGTIVVGDALINFEPYGFTFLPRKYCEDEKEMRVSLRRLLDKPAERMLFAHGTPILSNATEHLRQLLEADS